MTPQQNESRAQTHDWQLVSPAQPTVSPATQQLPGVGEGVAAAAAVARTTHTTAIMAP
jgi:hypothetical protein